MHAVQRVVERSNAARCLRGLLDGRRARAFASEIEAIASDGADSWWRIPERVARRHFPVTLWSIGRMVRQPRTRQLSVC